MLDSALRPVKDRALHPLARAIGGRVHPNLLSLLGFGAGACAALLLARGNYATALGLWILNRVVDGLDGAVARHSGRQSDLGGYLDILLDFAVYALIPVAAVMGRPETPGLFLALSLLLASFYLNAASWMYLAAILEKRDRGSRARGESTSVTMPRGLVEGTETIVFYTLFILFPDHLLVLFALMAAAVVLSVAQRLLWAARVL